MPFFAENAGRLAGSGKQIREDTREPNGICAGQVYLPLRNVQQTENDQRL
jgi:hypothetical protein